MQNSHSLLLSSLFFAFCFFAFCFLACQEAANRELLNFKWIFASASFLVDAFMDDFFGLFYYFK